MTVRCHKVPLLDVNVYFITSLEEAKVFIREHAVTEDEDKVVDGAVGACHTVTDSDGKNHRIMCVFDGDRNTTVHEAVHMAWIVLRYCSIKAGSANEEPLAYTAAWLAETMMEILEEA